MVSTVAGKYCTIGDGGPFNFLSVRLVQNIYYFTKKVSPISYIYIFGFSHCNVYSVHNTICVSLSFLFKVCCQRAVAAPMKTNRGQNVEQCSRRDEHLEVLTQIWFVCFRTGSGCSAIPYLQRFAGRPALMPLPKCGWIYNRVYAARKSTKERRRGGEEEHGWKALGARERKKEKVILQLLGQMIYKWVLLISREGLAKMWYKMW